MAPQETRKNELSNGEFLCGHFLQGVNQQGSFGDGVAQGVIPLGRKQRAEACIDAQHVAMACRISTLVLGQSICGPQICPAARPTRAHEFEAKPPSNGRGRPSVARQKILVPGLYFLWYSGVEE